MLFLPLLLLLSIVSREEQHHRRAQVSIVPITLLISNRT